MAAPLPPLLAGTHRTAADPSSLTARWPAQPPCAPGLRARQHIQRLSLLETALSLLGATSRSAVGHKSSWMAKVRGGTGWPGLGLTHTLAPTSYNYSKKFTTDDWSEQYFNEMSKKLRRPGPWRGERAGGHKQRCMVGPALHTAVMAELVGCGRAWHSPCPGWRSPDLPCVCSPLPLPLVLKCSPAHCSMLLPAMDASSVKLQRKGEGGGGRRTSNLSLRRTERLVRCAGGAAASCLRGRTPPRILLEEQPAWARRGRHLLASPPQRPFTTACWLARWPAAVI